MFGRSRIKYGERGYRFALPEAGHAMQNILPGATALGLGACPVGGFIDDRLHDLVDVDRVEEAVLYAAIDLLPVFMPLISQRRYPYAPGGSGS